MIEKSNWDKAKKDNDGNVTKEETSTVVSQSTELVETLMINIIILDIRKGLISLMKHGKKLKV
ncbi:MAG: hypothetical protein WDO71_19475 [Bacteroidota bacterium]